jgi:hypothetical protein
MTFVFFSETECTWPQMKGDCDCGAVDGMKIGKGNRSNRRKPAPTPLC